MAQRTAKLAPKPTKARNGQVRTVKPANGSTPKPKASTKPQAWKLGTPKPNREGTHPCACSPTCTADTRRTFAQGHDAKVYALVRRLHEQDGQPDKAQAKIVAHLQKRDLWNQMVAKAQA